MRYRILPSNRHQAHWQVAGVEEPHTVISVRHGLQKLSRYCAVRHRWQSIIADYASVGVSLRGHPLALLRPHLGASCNDGTRVMGSTGQVARACSGTRDYATTSGQRCQCHLCHPGRRNRIYQPGGVGADSRAAAQRVAKRYLDACAGRSSETGRCFYHVIAKRLDDRSALLRSFKAKSRDFH